MEPQQMEVDGSNDVPDFNEGWIFRFQPFEVTSYNRNRNTPQKTDGALEPEIFTHLKRENESEV